MGFCRSQYLNARLAYLDPTSTLAVRAILPETQVFVLKIYLGTILREETKQDHSDKQMKYMCHTSDCFRTSLLFQDTLFVLIAELGLKYLFLYSAVRNQLVPSFIARNIIIGIEELVCIDKTLPNLYMTRQ